MDRLYFYQLVLEEIAQIISNEEKVALHKAMASDADLYKIWQQTNEQFASEEIQLWLHREPQPFFDVQDSKPNRIKIVVIAVLMAIFLSFLVFWLIKS